jgi:uncharacterized phiE125 gp8 family phage protein
MSLSVFAAPAIDPLSLAEAKAHCNIDDSILDWDGLIGDLIQTANEHVEDFTHRAGISRTLDYKVDDFPGWYCALELPKPPLVSVTSVSYVDTNGVTQTWSSALYTILNAADETMPGQIVPAYQQSYPVTRDVPNAVTVRYVAGYGTDPKDVPARWKAAMKILIAHWFKAGREPVAVGSGTTVAPIPMTVDALLWPLKHFGI